MDTVYLTVRSDAITWDTYNEQAHRPPCTGRLHGYKLCAVWGPLCYWLFALRRCGVKLFPAGATDPVEHHGDHDVDYLIADEQAAQYGGGHGTHDFGAGARGPEHGNQADDGDAFG